ncbi:probable RNA-binding protein ARP1 [Impatiens glandulifera]|uniref:probable RNA-binding protein ARP1 n=1 Tax=Impatiens glandulifera TaxID=253017 RepID=UPI001FB0C11F|nr:probable RNA-binding protein ARP1 [Impatiens glandulifera]XP_047332780.1 probable RNA-binding protein ARP1 [Impatiens glandulifera]
MTMSSSSSNYGNGGGGGGGGVAGGHDHDQFGDTTLTKVFVGGLAWETPRELLWDYFQKFGDILEAVIISDKLTGRSKGYGFVTFKEPESAKKACEDATPTINGRRANCNLASLGARRPRSSAVTATSHHHNHQQQIQQTGPNPKPNGVGGPRSGSPAPVNNNHMQQWYYYPATPHAASPYHHHHRQHYQQTMPFYRYSPTAYVSSTDMGYNQKVSYAGGPYMAGHFAQMYPAQPVMGGNNLMPVYPVYHYGPAGHAMAAHIYSPSATGPMPTVSSLISKPV